jgi:phosphoglycolate phosphatase
VTCPARVAVIFDLDGTLIDSAPDMHAAVTRMLAGEGRAALSLAEVTSFVGNGLPKLVERVIIRAGLPMADHVRLTQVLLDLYTGTPAKFTKPYPGVIAALQTLQAAGHPMGICTNKPLSATHAVLTDLGLAAYFRAIIGGDSLPVTKPDPAPLRACMAALGADRVLFVGDSEVDAATAVAAAVPFALFTEGYRKSPVADMARDVVFQNFKDLPVLVAALSEATVELALPPLSS